MLKDFLKELFGIVFHGLTFERCLWILVFGLGCWISFRVWKAYRRADEDGKPRDLTFRVASGAGLVLFGGYQAIVAWFNPNYKLFFTEPLVLHTYGVAIALGFICAIWVGVREARRIGLDAARLLDLSFWLLISAMIGSRLVFMMVEFDSYRDRCFDPAAAGLDAPDCWAVLRFWEGGLVFYGGLIAAVVVGLYYLKKYNLDVWRYADVGAASIPLGQFFGRLGCLSAGCCHGKYVPSEHFLGIHWPADTAAYKVVTTNLALGADREIFLSEGFVTAHPTQLYESGATLMIFLFLMWFRTRKRFSGQLLIIYIVAYALIRSVIEIFRGDKVRGFIFKWSSSAVSELIGLPADEPLLLSTSQFISLLMVLGAVGLWIWRMRDAKRLPGPRTTG